jgi:SAM-dependent methyltransferase
MHDEVLAFARAVIQKFPAYETGSVLEIGSLIINGSVREVFPNASVYFGVDAHAGDGVDAVCLGHELDLPKKDFDVLVCAEVLEHDPYWWATLLNGYRHLRSGGLLIVTCAGPNRAPHNEEDSPVPGYYANVSAAQITAWARVAAGILHFDVREVRGNMDTHFWAVKP